MPGADHLQLLAHEFSNRLPVDPLGLRPLDRVVGDLDNELHARSLTDAMVREFLKVRNGFGLPGLRDYYPTLPITFP